jgi:hypothetical protein
MTHQILDSASEKEAEMAAIARACIMTALDHSKTGSIKVKIELEGKESSSPTLLLPPRALMFFADVLWQMAKREPMVLMPQKTELTTQEAAAFLNVSRPFVIKEIQAQRIACRMVNRHRRIEFEELMRYQREQKQTTSRALQRLSQLSKEIGEEL